MKDRRILLVVIGALAFLLDRATKHWVSVHVPIGHAVTVIPNFFRITHVLNTGAAFSMFADMQAQQRVRVWLSVFSAVAALVMLWLIWRYGRRLTMSTLAFALVMGGALGNLCDRVLLGQVIDFLSFNFGSYQYPDFNVADSCIVIGGLLLLADSFRTQRVTERDEQELAASRPQQ
jgi:signal peptidase II